MLTNFQLPKMNPYPQDHSVLVLDNCSIHKSEVLQEIVEASGCAMRFLPPYSPDFNPIKESFSCGEQFPSDLGQFSHILSQSMDSTQLAHGF